MSWLLIASTICAVICIVAFFVAAIYGYTFMYNAYHPPATYDANYKEKDQMQRTVTYISSGIFVGSLILALIFNKLAPKEMAPTNVVPTS